MNILVSTQVAERAAGVDARACRDACADRADCGGWSLYGNAACVLRAPCGAGLVPVEDAGLAERFVAGFGRVCVGGGFGSPPPSAAPTATPPPSASAAPTAPVACALPRETRASLDGARFDGDRLVRDDASFATRVRNL